MIYIDSINSVSDLIRNRAQFCWVVKVPRRDGLLEFRVTPYGPRFNHKEKTKRRTAVDPDDWSLTCVDWYSGEPCQANADYVLETGQEKRPRLCCHGYAVLEHLGLVEKQAEAA